MYVIVRQSWNRHGLQIRASGGSSMKIDYQYDAAGNKLRQLYTVNGTLNKTTDFVSNFAYENGTPAWVNFGEGRIVYNTNGTWFAENYIKDHLGNVRVAYYLNNGVVTTRQIDSYYPFGMNIKGLTVNKLSAVRPNEYLYNGKMFQDEGGLNWLDYGARFYDAIRGVWLSVDLKAEKYQGWSPYCYTLNNPLKFTDPDGTEVDGYKDLQGNYEWFDEEHNNLIYKNDNFWTKVTDNKDVFEMAKAGVLDNIPSQNDPGSIHKPDATSNFEMWLESPSSGVGEATGKVALNIGYGMVNSPFSLITGHTIAGHSLTSKEKVDAFVDTAPAFLSFGLTATNEVVSVSGKGLAGFNDFVKAVPEVKATTGLPAGVKWQARAGELFQQNKVNIGGLNLLNSYLKALSVANEANNEIKK